MIGYKDDSIQDLWSAARKFTRVVSVFELSIHRAIVSPRAVINIQSRNWSDLTDYTGSIRYVRSTKERDDKNSWATLSSAALPLRD